MTSDEAPAVILAAVDDNYWVLKGEEHLDAILSGADYPVPVGCIRMASIMALRMELGGAVNLQSLWSVHPQIVGQLRVRNHLLEIDGTTG
jgi:hypothetical protein